MDEDAIRAGRIADSNRTFGIAIAIGMASYSAALGAASTASRNAIAD